MLRAEAADGFGPQIIAENEEHIRPGGWGSQPGSWSQKARQQHDRQQKHADDKKDVRMAVARLPQRGHAECDHRFHQDFVSGVRGMFW